MPHHPEHRQVWPTEGTHLSTVEQPQGRENETNSNTQPQDLTGARHGHSPYKTVSFPDFMYPESRESYLSDETEDEHEREG